MSLATRVIPCLDVDGGRVVKGVNFENLRDAGDPVELAAAIAKALGTALNDTEAKPLVTMGIEDVVLDVGAIELGRRLPRQGAKIGPVVLMGKCDRYSLHPDLLSLSLHHKVPRGGGQD